MARLLINKHFTEHNEAINGFTNVEDYAFGEIIICNDSEKPSIYIKDVDNNSVAISNIKVSETDDILSLEDNKLSAKISMVWDSENDKIKLLGKTKNNTDVVLSEIEIFNDEKNGIGNKIDKAVERAVDVTLFTATDTELPEGTEIGQDYLKIETISNRVVKQSYIPFLTVNKLFTIEGEDNTDKSGKIIVTKDEENNKYIISHGEVNRVGEKLENPAFGLTPFISEIGVNDLGHVTSVKTSVLPSTPGISITTAPEELPEDDTNLYVSKVTKTDKMGLTVTYSELPKVDIDATVKNSTNKTLKFISNIEASGSIITGVTSEVNLEGYAKTGDYYEKSEIDEKLKKIIDPDGELIVPPVVITGDTTEVGKYIYDIDVNSEGALEIKTQTLGLDSYVKKEDVLVSDTTLEWDVDKEIIKIGEKITTVTLPIKPGIKISEEADTSSKKVIVGVESVETNTAGEVLSMKFKTKEFDFENALAKKDVAVPTTTPTLDWENAVTIATIGGTKIDVAMPNPINVEVTGEDVNEINSVVTAIEGDEHGIKVKNAPFATKNYVAKAEVNASNVELPWGTKDAEGNVNTTTIATIGEKSINVALPEKPVVGMVTGNTSIENPVVVTNIELNENNELVVNFQDALPKNYITSGDLKTYLDVDSIKVVDGTDSSTENKFITSIVTGKTEDNDVQLTVNYGKYNIDDDITISSETVQLEWDTPKEIAKIGNKTISVKLPLEPEKGEGADGNTLYNLSGTLTDDEFKVSLMSGTDGVTYNTPAGSATLNLRGYLTSGDVGTYIPVKGVQVDNVSVLDKDGIAKITGTTVVSDGITLEWGKSNTIAKVNNTEIKFTMPEAPAQVETKVDDVQINGTTIVNEKIANIEVVDNNNTLAWNTSVEIAKVGGVPITAKLPVKPDGSNGVTDTTYTLSGATSSDNFKVTLIGSDNSTGIATLNFSDIPFNETSITTGKTNTGNFVKNITFNGNKNHTVNVEYGDPDLSEYSKEGHTHAEYVNQNAFGKVTDGTTTVIADSTIDTLTIAGSGNITVSANASTDTITIGINDGSYSKEGHTHTEYAPVSHKHIASDITGGTLNIARIPTGTDVNSVALGNHGHDGVYLKERDFHDTNATLDGHYDPLASLTTTTLSAEDSKYISAISFDQKKHITGITTTALPTSAESAKKLTAGTVGSTTIPVYFKDGEPAVCTLNYLTDSDITQNYLTTKIGNHYLTAETYKGTVTDAKTVVSNTNTGIANAATTNGATYLNTVLTNNGNTNVVSSHNIKGSGSVTVSSDVNGVITISGVEYQPIGNYLTKETYLGTISGITVGSGLTGGGSAVEGVTGITIKPNLSSYSSLGTIGTTSKLYAVGVDNDNRLCVNVPWADEKNNGTVTSVKIETGSTYVALTGSTITSSGTYTFDLSEATKTKIDNGSIAYGWGNHADKGYWIPENATTGKTGIVKLVEGDMNGKPHADGQAPSLAHTHSQYLTSTDVNNKGYATEKWVKEQGYLTDEYDLPIATATALGGIKLGYTELGQNYAVKTLTDGTAYVTVPWSDTQCIQSGHYSPENVTETVSVGNQKPSHGGTFNIPTISFDSKGHYVSTGTTTVTLPEDNYVTNVAYHYTPTATSTNTISKDASGTISATWGETSLVTGIEIKRDAKGHVTDVTLDAVKMPDNPNTHYISKNIVTNVSTGKTDTAALNGSVYLNHIENGVVSSSHLLNGINGIFIARPSSGSSINVGINYISGGTGITSGSTGYTQGKAVYEYVDKKLEGFSGSDEKVKSEVIDNTTKAYLLASSASTAETGTALKSSSIFMSGNTLTAAAFYQDSDERLKDFHNEIEVDFDKLRDLPKSYFTWKSDDTKTIQLGTSAQKVKELYPELVGGTEESLSVDYARLSIVALKAVDKLHEENEKLKAELDVIKKHLGL